MAEAKVCRESRRYRAGASGRRTGNGTKPVLGDRVPGPQDRSLTAENSVPGTNDRIFCCNKAFLGPRRAFLSSCEPDPGATDESPGAGSLTARPLLKKVGRQSSGFRVNER